MDLKKLKASASATPPLVGEAVSDGYHTAGSAVDDIPASKPGPYYHYQIQQELHAILTDGGIAADKATLTQLRDAIRVIANAKAAGTPQTTVLTGSQNDFAATAQRRLVLRGNNATTLTLTGIAAGTDGDVIEVVSVGAGEVDITHQDGGSTAVNRVITPTAATVKLTAGKGRAWLLYDGTTQRWRLTNADPASTQIVQEGISFPATQVASSDANTLDDYEEGSFTPTIIGSTTPGTQTYGNRAGHYVKIGQLVHVEGFVSITAKDGSIAGNINLGGLPFTSLNVSNLETALALGQINSVTLDAGNTQFGLRIDPNTAVAIVIQMGSNIGAQAIGVGNLGTITQIFFSGSYSTAT